MSHCPNAKTGVATGLRERGLLSTAHMQCGKNGEFDGGYLAWLYLFIYIVIVLYSYILIYLYCYCIVYLLCCLFIALLHAWSMGVLLSLYLYSIFVPYFDFYFYMILVAVSLYHLAFYRAKVWLFCQIPNTRRCLIRLKLFRNAFHKCCTFGLSEKLSTELFGVLTLGNHHLFMHVKRLYDDEMTEW